MRLVYFGNNRLGLQVLQYLVQAGADLAALVLHPLGRRRYGDEFLALARDCRIPVHDATVLSDVQALRSLAPEPPVLGVSVMFGYIFKPEVLRMFPAGIVNLHLALLPHNRGAAPNVWSIVEGTPAGVTLHWVDAGIDTGDVIGQREVRVEPTDTGASLYRRLEENALGLFVQHWPAIAAGSAPRIRQAPGGTTHRLRDLDDLDRIELDRSYRAGELLDILRARTFPPYPGAYFERAGKKIYLRLQLLPEEDLE